MHSNLRFKQIVLLIGFLLATFAVPVNAQLQSHPLELIERYYEIELNIPSEEQFVPIEKLLLEAENFRDENIENAEAWITSGLIHAGFGTKQTNPLRGRSEFKTAREQLETAIQLDKNSLDGYAVA